MVPRSPVKKNASSPAEADGRDAVEKAILAKHVSRRRSARCRLVLAWLIAACRLGKTWSLRMSYSCLSLRLSRPSATMHAAYQKICDSGDQSPRTAQRQHTLRKRRPCTTWPDSIALLFHCLAGW